MFRVYSIIFLCIVLLSGCNSEKNSNVKKNTSPKNENKISKNTKQLSIGSIAVTHKYEENIHRPIIQYLTDKMKHYGYTEAKSTIVSSMDELIEKANNDEVDIFFGSLYPTITVDGNSKLVPTLKAFENGVDYYSSIFFTKNNSPITSIKNISGYSVVFKNNYSTSGYYYPMALLKKYGYKLVEYRNPTRSYEKNTVGYSLSNDDENTVFWILSGYADIGVTHNDSYKFYTQEKSSELKILHESRKIIRNIVSIRSDFPQNEKQELIQILINMPDDEVGKPIISKFFNITKFEVIDSVYYSELRNDFENYFLK